MTHAELCARAAQWLRAKGCRIVLSEFTTAHNEIPDAIGFRGTRGKSYLIEAKASRSDFLSDRKKPFRAEPAKGMGQFRYFMCEPGTIRPDELPERWGLLYAHEKRVTIEYGKDPRTWGGDDDFAFAEYDHRAERGMLLSALIRLGINHGFPEIHRSIHKTFLEKSA